MTLRTKSKSQQWTVWFCAVLVLLGAYVILSRVFNGSFEWGLCPRQYRLAVPLLALFGYVAWNTRWDGIRREKGRRMREQGDEKAKVEGQGQEGGREEKVGGESRRRAEEEKKSKCEVEESNLTSGAASPLDGALGDRALPAGQHNEKADIHSSTSTLDFDSSPVHRQPQPPPSTSSLTGEALFDQARALPHQEIPDFDFDGLYLDLLGQSAAAGHAPALAKLGEYAMRRAAWVEAYYWMSMAKRQGMLGLANVMREIRKNWSLDGFPDEAENVYPLFTVEAGSIGRALLHVDSGHEAANACEFLKANHPEFMT